MTCERQARYTTCNLPFLFIHGKAKGVAKFVLREFCILEKTGQYLHFPVVGYRKFIDVFILILYHNKH